MAQPSKKVLSFTTYVLTVWILTLLVTPGMCWRKFETAGMIPKSKFEEQGVIYGLVERVVDGDTIRVRHLPLYAARLWGRQPAPLQQRGISQDTILVRLYGIDCPELKKGGNPGQPGSEEAKEFTSHHVLHQVVKITLLRKDQYARVVGAVECLPKGGPCFKWVPGLGRRDLSVMLAKEGMAELYTGGGAEYWVGSSDTTCMPLLTKFSQGKRELLENCIEKARRQRLGIWAIKDRESAADHKKRLKSGAPSLIKESATKVRGGGIGSNSDRNKAISRSTTKRKPKMEQPKKKGYVTSSLIDAAITGLELIPVG